MRIQNKFAITFLFILFYALLFPQFGLAGDLTPPDKLVYPPLDFRLPKAERIVLQNGMVLFFLEDRELPVVSMNFILRSGTMYDPVGKEGVAELTASLLRTGGTTRLGSDLIDQKLDALAASPSFSMSLDSASVQATFFKTDLEAGMDLLSQMMMQPAFEEKKFQLAVSLKTEDLKRIVDNPQRLAFREFNRLVYPDDPRGRYMTTASLRNITRNDLIAFHKAYFFPANIMVAVSGDLSREEAVNLFQKHFAGWNNAGIIPEIAKTPVKTASGTFLMRKALSQSTVVSGEFTVGKNDPDFYSFLVLDFIIGSGGFPSHIFSAVRNNEGLAYSAGSFYRPRPNYGVFGTYAFTKTSTTYQALNLINEILKKAAEGSMTDAELSWAKNSIRNGFIFSFDHPAYIASQQMTIAFEKLPENYLTDYLKNIDLVKRDDLKRVTVKYLHEKKRLTLILGDTDHFGKQPDFIGKPVYITPLE